MNKASSKSIKEKTVSSLFWKLLERNVVQGVQFIVQIVLARLLLPSDYGLIAIVLVFIQFANVFVQNGFNTALIQKKDTDSVDFSSVFYLSLCIAGLLYAILFFAAPLLGEFFKQPQLARVLRVLSITLFFGATNSIQNSYLARKSMFRELFISTLGAALLSGLLGVIAAMSGWGVWALVIHHLVSQLATTIFLWFNVEWRPQPLFSIERVKVLFSYGWKLLISSLLDTLYRDIQSLLIGRMYSPGALGFYNRGNSFPNLIVGNIVGSIQSVLFPVLSSHQDNRVRVKDMVRRAIVTSAFLVFPMMVGLAVIAEPFIVILLTDKWLPAVPFMRILCASYALWPIHTANLQAINALGRSDIFLKLECIKKIVGIIILSVSIPFGIYAIAWSVVINGILGSFINAYPNLKLLNYSYPEQWKDITPSLLISLIMGVVVHSISFFNFAVPVTLILQIVSGVVIYVGLARLFRVESFTYLLTTIRDVATSRKGIAQSHVVD